MPIIDLYKARWEYNSSQTGLRYKHVCDYNGLIPKDSFFKQVNIKKAVKKFTCRCCDKQRAKGTRYLGDNWNKICQYCLPNWIENTKISFQHMTNALLKTENSLKENKDKWYKEALIGELDTN